MENISKERESPVCTRWKKSPMCPLLRHLTLDCSAGAAQRQSVSDFHGQFLSLKVHGCVIIWHYWQRWSCGARRSQKIVQMTCRLLSVTKISTVLMVCGDISDGASCQWLNPPMSAVTHIQQEKHGMPQADICSLDMYDHHGGMTHTCHHCYVQTCHVVGTQRVCGKYGFKPLKWLIFEKLKTVPGFCFTQKHNLVRK